MFVTIPDGVLPQTDSLTVDGNTIPGLIYLGSRNVASESAICLDLEGASTLAKALVEFIRKTQAAAATANAGAML
jgi:hypothetical protein